MTIGHTGSGFKTWRHLVLGVIAAMGLFASPLAARAGETRLSVSAIDVATNTTSTRDLLVVYTPAFGGRTAGNNGGVEAEARNGRIVRFGLGNSVIPRDGFVVCGSGKYAEALMNGAELGCAASFDPRARAVVLGAPLWRGLPNTWKDNIQHIPAALFLSDEGRTMFPPTKATLDRYASKQNRASVGLSSRIEEIRAATHPFVKWNMLKDALGEIPREELVSRGGLSLVEEYLQTKLNQGYIDSLRKQWGHPTLRPGWLAHHDAYRQCAEFAAKAMDPDLAGRIEQWKGLVDKQFDQAMPQKEGSDFLEGEPNVLGRYRTPETLEPYLRQRAEWDRLRRTGRYLTEFPWFAYFPGFQNMVPYLGVNPFTPGEFEAYRGLIPPLLRKISKQYLTEPLPQRMLSTPLIQSYNHMLLEYFLTQGEPPVFMKEADGDIELYARCRDMAHRLAIINATFADSMESLGIQTVWAYTGPEKFMRTRLIDLKHSAEAVFAKYLDPVSGILDPRKKDYALALRWAYSLNYGMEHMGF